MGLREVKTLLNTMKKEELIKIIGELYKNNKLNKEYLDFLVEPNETALHKKYRDLVYEAFYPKRGMRLKLKQGKQAITDFKKLNPSPELLADLMLFFIETAAKFTYEYGDIGEDFYTSIETSYENTLIFMNKNNLLEPFLIRSEKMLKKAKKCENGFHDDMLEIFYEFYADILDDE
jgi:hypothetical protein